MRLPATPGHLNGEVLEPAMALLPPNLDGIKARQMLITIAQQESDGLKTRRQYGNGPARGLWQFERGTAASRGGVWGVFLHPASKKLLAALCKARVCVCDPMAIWERLEHDDLMAAGVARLLLLTDPYPLPMVDDAVGSWEYYLRTWRPGRPHPEKWLKYHDAARAALKGWAPEDL